jgi:hypothetical protein
MAGQRAQFDDPPLLGAAVRYSPDLGVWEAATIIATKTQVDADAFLTLGISSPSIRRSQNVHLLRGDGTAALNVEPASDTGEHGPNEWCHDDVNCRVPGT